MTTLVVGLNSKPVLNWNSFIIIELLSQDLDNIQERIDRFSMELSKALNQPVQLDVDIIPYHQFNTQSQPDYSLKRQN